MKEDNESVPAAIREITSVIDNPDFTEEEIEFLLERLKNLKDSNSMDQSVEELISFLIDQLHKFKTGKEEIKVQTQSKKTKEDEVSKVESRQLEKFNCDNSLESFKLRSLLQKRLKQFVIINLIIGGECCQVEGVLCNIANDFITLIYQNQIIYIKINSIAAIEKKINNSSKSDNLEKNKEIKTYKDQYYTDEVNNVQSNESKKNSSDNSLQESSKKSQEYQSDSKTKESSENGEKIKKRKKSYTKVNEE